MAPNARTAETIQSALDAATSDRTYGVPGLVFVAVDRNGNQLAANTSGVRSLETKAPMTLDTVFWIASCTKLITGIAAMQLVEQGSIGLDDATRVCSIRRASWTSSADPRYRYSSSVLSLSMQSALTSKASWLIATETSL